MSTVVKNSILLALKIAKIYIFTTWKSHFVQASSVAQLISHAKNLIDFQITKIIIFWWLSSHENTFWWFFSPFVPTVH